MSRLRWAVIVVAVAAWSLSFLVALTTDHEIPQALNGLMAGLVGWACYPKKEP